MLSITFARSSATQKLLSAGVGSRWRHDALGIGGVSDREAQARAGTISELLAESGDALAEQDRDAVRGKNVDAVLLVRVAAEAPAAKNQTAAAKPVAEGWRAEAARGAAAADPGVQTKGVPTPAEVNQPRAEMVALELKWLRTPRSLTSASPKMD